MKKAWEIGHPTLCSDTAWMPLQLIITRLCLNIDWNLFPISSCPSVLIFVAGQQCVSDQIWLIWLKIMINKHLLWIIGYICYILTCPVWKMSGPLFTMDQTWHFYTYKFVHEILVCSVMNEVISNPHLCKDPLSFKSEVICANNVMSSPSHFQ